MIVTHSNSFVGMPLVLTDLPEKIEYMASRAANFANSIPLALCVIGSNLKGKSIEE